MSYQRDRERFIADMIREGLSYDLACQVLRDAQAIQTCAERECSDESADRDRVPCPKDSRTADGCLCRDYGTGAEIRAFPPGGGVGVKAWQHGDVPRFAVRSFRAERRIASRLPNGFRAKFGGDPRGCCVKILVPSGRYDTWGGAEDGMGVPTRG